MSDIPRDIQLASYTYLNSAKEVLRVKLISFYFLSWAKIVWLKYFQKCSYFDRTLFAWLAFFKDSIATFNFSYKKYKYNFHFLTTLLSSTLHHSLFWPNISVSHIDHQSIFLLHDCLSLEAKASRILRGFVNDMIYLLLLYLVYLGLFVSPSRHTIKDIW